MSKDRRLSRALRRIADDVDAGTPQAVAAMAAVVDADLDNDGDVDTDDLLLLIGAWTGPIVQPPPPPPPPTGLTPSGPIHLAAGASTISNKAITSSDKGIEGDNATHVTTLNVSNVEIRSTNYGIYLGSCDKAVLDRVSIFCDPNGGDSYSIRGAIQRLEATDCEFHSGIKAWRVYGLEGGFATRCAITGDRLMLGGGYASEWGTPGPFHNFTFTGGSINVGSVEMYGDTNNVVFDGVDFSGTHHVSIHWGAHHITFRNCKNLPEIRRYGTTGILGYGPDPVRSIVVQ